MATLHSITSGSFSAASTWGLVDTTSLNNTIAGNSTLLTSPQASPAFTPGPITVKGVSINIQSVAASPSGTMTVALYNAAGSSVASVTINVADLPSTGAIGTPYIGWTYFQFASPVTLAAANAHTLRLNTSVASMVNVYSVTVTANWARALVTTTTQAPAATDILLISGQHTAAGTFSPYVVTMDITSNATTYGQLAIGTRGTLSYGVATSTNYALKLAGSLYVGQGGTLNIGTLATPIPATSTATLEISCASALQYSIFVYGTLKTYGATKTVASKLASDVIVGATSSTSTTSTGWKSGDVIVVPSTTRTYTQFEQITLNADAIGTALSHGAYVNAHGGNATTMVQADIVNSTRNITILSTSTTFRTNIQMFAYSVTSFYYTKFQDLGTSITVANSGICVNSLTSGIGSFDFQYNVVLTTVVQSAILSANTALFTNSNTALTISNNLFYKLGWTATVTSTVSSLINDGNYIIACLSSQYCLLANYMGSNNVITSNAGTSYAAVANNFFNNATNNSFYSNSTIGLSYNSPATTNSPQSITITGLKIWRNNTYGISLTLTNGGNFRTQIFTTSDSYIFGNGSGGIFTNNRAGGKFYFNNCYIYGGTTLVQPYAFSINSSYIVDTFYFNNCYFGYSDSSLTTSPHSTAIINGPATAQVVLFSNCYFNSTEVVHTNGIASTNVEAGYTSFRHNGATGSNKTWYSNGVLTTDTTIYNTSSPSVRMAPVSATYKLTHPTIKVPIKAGKTCNVSVNVRKSITTDGTQYGGGIPRLIYAFNPVLGNLTETIGFNMTSTSNWVYAPGLLTNSAWIKSTFDTITGTQLAPDGSSTAFLINETGASANQSTVAQGNILAYSTTVTYTVWTKTGTAITRDFLLRNNTTLTNFDGLSFNYSSTGNLGNGWTSTNVGNGWFKLVYTKSTGISIGDLLQIYIGRTGGAVSGSTATWYIWQPTVLSQPNDVAIYGQWETISYTTPAVVSDGVAEFYIDCDGSIGWINVDDWNTTTSNDSRGNDFWNPSGTYIESDWRRPGATKTFTS